MLSATQSHEVRTRIPIALITKNMPQPEQITAPVHQIDVAPTIAAIAGLPFDQTWLGKDLFSHPTGTPPLTYTKGVLTYRIENSLCHTQYIGSQTQCWAVGPQQDPMFYRDLPPLAEEKAMTRLLRGIVAANHRLLSARVPRQK